MRLRESIGFGCLALFGTACGGTAPPDDTTTSASSKVVVLHALPGVAPTDVYVMAALAYPSLPYGEESRGLASPPGANSVSLFIGTTASEPACRTDPSANPCALGDMAATATPLLEAGRSSLVVFADAEGQSIALEPGELDNAASETFSRARFVNAMPKNGPVDIELDPVSSLPMAGFRSVSERVAVPTTGFALGVRDASGATLIDTVIPLEPPARRVTVVIFGDGSSGGEFRAVAIEG